MGAVDNLGRIAQTSGTMGSMRTPSPLPEDLLSGPFTVDEWRSAGLTYGRLRAGDLDRVGRGLYTVPERGAHDGDRLLALARAVCAASPGAWVSHESAAALLNLPVPSSLRAGFPLHISKPRALPQARREGIVAHNVTAFPEEITVVRGVPVGTPPRTFLDLARKLPLEDLVALGDHLIRLPRPELEGRSAPLTTLPALRALLARHGNLQGIRKARLSLDLMRVGADSVPETKLRLAIVEAGLPEPQLQVRLRPHDRYSPSVDAGYLGPRVGVLYEGEHHLTPWQQSTDMERDAQYSEAGWILVKANRHDLRNGFARTISRVRSALVRRGALPGAGVVRLAGPSRPTGLPRNETPHQDMR